MAVELSIVVPTYNAASLVDDLLQSISNVRDETQFEVVINDDPRTNDDTVAVVDKWNRTGLNVRLLTTNSTRTVGRKLGAADGTGRVLLHLDADMQVRKGLLAECVARIGADADALIIPEESFGTTFWARCRWLEKKIYDGVDEIESLRCLSAALYEKVEGHNDTLVFSEDKDLDIRVRATGARIERTKHGLRHNEGAPTLREIFRKKSAYMTSASSFAEAQADAHAWETSMGERIRVLFAKPRLIVNHPILFGGIGVIGITEVLALRKARHVTGAPDVHDVR